MSARIRGAMILLLAVAAPRVAHGQDTAAAPWGLFSVRYDTRTSDFIYAAYGYGRVFGMVAVLQNPRSGYNELLGAVGGTFTVQDGTTQFAAIGAARASDSWYAQLYYLPNLRYGPVAIRATSEMYLPLNRAGTVQLALSPLSATVAVARHVEAGLALDASAAQHAAASTAIGPEIRIALPHAVLGSDVEQVLPDQSTRLRLFFSTSF